MHNTQGIILVGYHHVVVMEHLTVQQLKTLSCIALTSEEEAQLTKDLQAIMDLVNQLTDIDTKDVEPLYHPLDLKQRLRLDTVTEENHCEQLAQSAPVFEDGLYLVPKVIDIEQ